MLRVFKYGLLACAIFAQSLVAEANESQKKIAILASIKPIQLIVQAIAGEEQSVDVLVPPGMSLHDYALRPSDLHKIQNANLVVWLGPHWEPYLGKALPGSEAEKSVDISGLKVAAKHEHKRGHEAENPHVWLSLVHAKRMAEQITEKLSVLNPDADLFYQNNLAAFIEKLSQLDIDLKKSFAHSGGNYFVYHDAYSYFETEYGLEHAGVISEHHEVKPGAKHILNLRKVIASDEVRCIIVEPESNLNIVHVITEGFSVYTQLLDPMASAADSSIDGYIGFIRTLGKRLAQCRGGGSAK